MEQGRLTRIPRFARDESPEKLTSNTEKLRKRWENLRTHKGTDSKDCLVQNRCAL
jgi:hypothetical protein